MESKSEIRARLKAELEDLPGEAVNKWLADNWHLILQLDDEDVERIIDALDPVSRVAYHAKYSAARTLRAFVSTDTTSLLEVLDNSEQGPTGGEPASAEAVGEAVSELWQRWITNEITALDLVVGLHGLGLDPYKLPHTRNVANKEPRDQAEQIERGWGYLVENHYDSVTQIDFGKDRGLSRSTVNRAVKLVEGILEHAGVGTEERIRLIRMTET